jgi:hypothetical protein
VGKIGDLKDGVWIQMNKLNFDVKEIASREPKPALEERFGDHDFIGIGGWISSSLASRHWRAVQGGRRWFSTNFRILPSPLVDSLNISRCDVPMEAERGFWNG